MFEQFNHHPELKWLASVAGQFYTGEAKFQINPDLLNFKLERFLDLRKTAASDKQRSFKLMLVGINNTNVSVDGPDNLINTLIGRLSSYIGKPWAEIVDINLKRNVSNCENFLIDNKCNPWVIDKLELKEITLGRETPYFTSADLIEVDKICLKCAMFMEKKTIKDSNGY